MKLFFILFSIIIFYINFFPINSSISFIYPSAISLSNGNILIIHKIGIDIYDSTVSNLIKNIYIFTNEEQIKDVENLSKVILKESESYIFCIISDKIFIFDNEGNLLYKSDNKIINNSSPKYYTLSPIYIKDNIYYYIIGFFDSNNYLNLFLYKFDIISKSNIKSISKKDEKFKKKNYEYNFKNKGLSCEYMTEYNNSEKKVLVCFFLINSNNNINSNSEYIIEGYYTIKENSIINNYNYENDYYTVPNIEYIKSQKNNNSKLSLVCYVLKNNKPFCNKFRINSSLNGEFYKTVSFINNCKNLIYGMKISYFNEIEKIVFSCSDSDGSLQLSLFDNNLNTPDSFYKLFNSCQTIFGYSVLYIAIKSEYYILSDVKCNNIEYPFKSLVTSGEEINQKLEEKALESDIECTNKEKCLECNKESMLNNLCIKCNIQNGYFPLRASSEFEQSFLNNNNNQYIDCVNEKEKPSNFYFNYENQDFESCYDTCATCEYKGDGNENNCTSCEENYIKKPDYENSTNCVLKCNYFYYYTSYNQYKCTDLPKCPEDYNLLIKNKNKCVDNCTSDDIYKYQYIGECLEKCPNNTKNDNYLCKDLILNKCLLTEKPFNFLNEDFKEHDIEIMAKTYATEFKYTNNHVLLYKNKNYLIVFYKNGNCITELSLQIPEINFSECFEKVKNNLKIEENLVISIINKKENDLDYYKMISYSMFDPKTGEKLLIDDICKDDIIIIKEDLISKINSSGIEIDTILHLTSQDIDVFNLSSKIYTDICFYYDSQINKDISLNDRILIYHPNITLCENECYTKEVNISSLKAICECKFNVFNTNILSTENNKQKSKNSKIKELISSTNIEIIKCIKDIFNKEYFSKCASGFIIIGLIFIQIIVTIVYGFKSLYSLRKYIFGVTNNYLTHLSHQKNNNALYNYSFSLNDNNIVKQNDNEPPKRKENEGDQGNFNEIGENINIKRLSKKGKTTINRNMIFPVKSNENFMKKNSKNMVNNNNMNNQNQNNNIILSLSDSGSSEQAPKNNNVLILSNNNNNNSYDKPKIRRKNKTKTNIVKRKNKFNFDEIPSLSKDPLNKNNKNNLFANANEDLNINIEEYLSTEIDDMDYDDAIKKDKREFCNFLGERLFSNQIILNAFFYEEPLKPRTIKLLLLILQIDLHFFVNGLFFNEEYISQIFHLEEDKFYDKFIRFIGNFFYAALVGIIVNYIVFCIFIEEKKIKGILKREKDNLYVLKYEIVQIIKDIKKRYLFFIVLSYIITIFSWIHISCFNKIYPHMSKEWLIFSVIIIICMQILSVLICLLETILRFISFKIKSERIYKISLLLS